MQQGWVTLCVCVCPIWADNNESGYSDVFDLVLLEYGRLKKLRSYRPRSVFYR